MTAVALNSSQELQAILKAHPVVALDFWVEWSEPCQPMNDVFDLLAQQHPQVKFLKVHAENLSDVSEKYGLASVPCFLFLKHGTVVDKVEGANAPELRSKTAKWAAEAAAAKAASPAAAAAASPASPVELKARLEGLINFAPVMVFIKGTPDEPRCGFSRQIVEILRGVGAKFGSFDILTDEAVRAGLKEYSNWPTYPQLYVNGKLIGGLDIVREMNEAGELKPAVTVTEDDLNGRLEKLVKREKVMLFMKGTAEAPRCGFSRQMVELLRSASSTPFGSFDVLNDETVRNGLRTYSNWPTYPQLYVKGKLVGGLDIAKELHENGELKGVLEAN
jgi:Grx4 family monothiol glutaredoxin